METVGNPKSNPDASQIKVKLAELVVPRAEG